MRRYQPSDEEAARIRSFERQLGIEKPAGRRELQGVQEWSELWARDPVAWTVELRSRGASWAAKRRFAGYQQAILDWEPTVPSVPDRRSGRLSGVPVVVKDLFDVQGDRTRCGAGVFGRGPARQDQIVPEPARDDSWLVGRMKAAGAVVVGRGGMNEFAFGVDGRNPHTGDCPHPIHPERISGGSSSGSAWAVSTGLVPVALGTDTGGSIRIPAALCGVFGIRLPYRAEWLDGVFPLSVSLDTVGWFARSGADLLWIADSIGVLPEMDFLGEQRGVPVVPDGPSLLPDDAKGRDSAHPLGGIRIHWVEPPGVRMGTVVRDSYERLLQSLGDAGADISFAVDTDLLAEPAMSAYTILGTRDAYQTHARYLRHHAELYDPVVRQLIDRGRYWKPETIAEAEAVRSDVRSWYASAASMKGVVMGPSVPGPAPRFDEAGGSFREDVLRLNVPVSLSGLGTISIPIRDAPGGTIGVHLAFRDDGDGIMDRSDGDAMRAILDWTGRNRTGPG